MLGQAHINICVALFCGLVTFLSGIETASKYEVGIIIQYNDQLLVIVVVLGYLYHGGITLALFLLGPVLLDDV